MKKILVPLDFSDVSKSALEFAVDLSQKAESEILFYHVIEHPSPAMLKTMGVSDYEPMEVMYLKKLIEQTEQKAHAIISEVKEPNIKIDLRIKLGNPEREIFEEVRTSDIDLIIMGTSGSQGLDEFFVGSNAEKVVRHAKCPVITLQNPSSISEINEIVFASDFANDDTDFIGQLKNVQNTFEAKLRVVKINTPASFTSTRFDNKLMKEFVSKNEIENFEIDIYNYSNEEDGIVAFSEDIEADMIALGTYQFKGVGHFLRGSIAEDVVNHSNIPVWTYHLQK